MGQQPTHNPIPDPAGLTDAQLDGSACVVCRRDTAAMRPVGRVNGVQVFACTSHDAQWPDGEPATVRDAADEQLSADAVEGDLVRIIKRLEDAVASHDPAALDHAIRTARPCLERVRAWLDAREATK